MRILILCYSHSGNNRKLARRLAERLGAELEEVVPNGWRTFFSILLDSARNRRPALQPVLSDPAAFDHVILMAPVWDMKVANPMAGAIEELRDRLPAYSFVTLCGYRREGQEEALRAQLTDLAGRPPEALTQFFVGDLLPEKDRWNVLKVSGRKVSDADLEHFSAGIDGLAAGFGR